MSAAGIKKARRASTLPSLVYALEAKKSNHSYVGVTDNFKRRLKEHNGQSGKGRGARYTKGRAWRPIFRVTGLPTRRQALQLEKLFHKGFKGRRLVTVPRKPANPFGTSAAARRAWHLYWALKKDRFSQQACVLTRHLELKVEWLRRDFFSVAKSLEDWGPASVKHVYCSKSK